VVLPDTGEKTVLFPGKQPEYLEPGILVYSDPTLGLMGRAFDPATLEYGRPVGLGIDVLQASAGGGVQFRVSPSGTLVYVRGSLPEQQGGLTFARVDQTGRIEPIDAPARDYRFPSVSPDGRQLAVQIGTDADADIFVYDLSGDSEIRQLTFDGSNQAPVWTPDGAWIVYSSDRDGAWRIYRQRADGAGVAEPLTASDGDARQGLPALAPDGRLAYTRISGAAPAQADIWAVSLPDGEPELLVGGAGDQFGIVFSPDGTAMAYTSNTSGPYQVFAEPYPPDGSRVRISEDGVGTIWPVWSRDGSRLSYQLTANGGVGVVDIDTKNRFAMRNRRAASLRTSPDWRLADGVPDTDGWLIALPPAQRDFGSAPSLQIVVVENWIQELEARVPPLD
jgi:WD40 repeat protein